MLPPSEPLDALTRLDPEHLYLFAVGPKRGEALAVRLPEVGWLLVDCCRVKAADGSEVLPQAALVERFPGPIAGALLTHPHQDHVDGFADLIGRLPPERVMVGGGDPPARHLVDAVEAALAAAAGRDRLVAKQVRAAAVAIRQWEARTRRTVTPLHTGTPLWTTPVSVVCRAPDMTAARPLLQGGDLAGRANELSAVLEIQWGDTRMVLGGDLPRVETNRQREILIPSGWDLVMQQRPELGEHTGLKVPHHASWAAMHPSLMRPAPDQRAWVVTPLHNGKNHLPSLDVNDGLDLLHHTEPCVMDTCEPRVAAGRAIWDLAALRASVRSPVAANPVVARGKVLAPNAPLAPLDAMWAVALDNAGHVVARYRGAAAFDAVP